MTPDCTIVHLTDTHIVAPGCLVRDVVDTADNLRTVLDRIIATGRTVDVLLLTGDLTDNGDPLAYRRLREIVEPAAATLDAQIIYALGNHDSHSAFRAELVPEPSSSDPSGPSFDTVADLANVRVITMDSTLPGRHDGGLSADQLSWLATQLATPSRSGTTVLAMHHPPLRSAIDPVDALRLRDPEDLAEVIAGSEVRMILCGHAHLTGTGALAGVPIWIGPAMSYRIDPFAPLGRHRGWVGYGFTRVDVLDGSVVATAVEETPTTAVYDTDEEQTLATLRELAHEV